MLCCSKKGRSGAKKRGENGIVVAKVWSLGLKWGTKISRQFVLSLNGIELVCGWGVNGGYCLIDDGCMNGKALCLIYDEFGGFYAYGEFVQLLVLTVAVLMNGGGGWEGVG